MTAYSDMGMADPMRCRLELHVTDENEARDIRSKFQPLLVGVDPSFLYINVHTPTSLLEERRGNVSMEDIHKLAKLNHAFNKHQITGTGSSCACAPPGGACEKLKTPAIAVMLFLKQTSVVSFEQAQNILKSPPWKFHHKIELSNARKGQLKVIGKQEFYQSGRKLPLWSVCPIHYGNKNLRFTIFTRNFSSMVDFYRLLVGHEAEFTRENFCLFTVHSRPGLDLQLAIKQSAQLHPAPLSSAFLNFRVPNVRQLEAMIHTPNGMAGTLGRIGDNLWMLQDPDLNCILVEQMNNIDPITRSPVSTVTTDAHNGNIKGFNSQDMDPFRRSRALKEQIDLVKSEYQQPSSNSGGQRHQYNRRCFGADYLLNRPFQPRRERWPLPLYSHQGDADNGSFSLSLSDHSSHDSGRHSWRSGQEETGGSSSEQSGQSDDAETSSVVMTACDCHVITTGRCAHCTARTRPVLAPLPWSKMGQIASPSHHPHRRSEHEREVMGLTQKSPSRTKPWEIEAPEFSEVDWDGLLSLADSDDVNFR